MKQIILAGLIYDSNLGDQLIFECSYKMLKEIVDSYGDNISIIPFDLYGRSNQTDIINYTPLKLSFGYGVRRLFFPLRYRKTYKNKMGEYLLSKYSEKQFDALINNNVKAIVFVGGGLIKYKYQDFSSILSSIISKADKRKIPIMFSGVGVEGYSDNNYSCKKLEDALNRDCVKIITTRDDYESLKKYCHNNQILGEVADPACCSYRYYPLSVSENRNRKRKIGLGVARKDLFLDNGVNYSNKDYSRFWINIFNYLETKGYECEFFTNGSEEDYSFAEMIVSLIGDNSLLQKRPTNTHELITTIASYDATIVTRLHASIISYSYSIPTIGIVWNNKQLLFGNTIGFPERFILPSDSLLDDVIQQLEKALTSTYQKSLVNKDEYLNTTYQYLRKFILDNI